MSLMFLNPSRSYDETRQQVRFSGHDGMFEIAFRIDADVLAGKGNDDQIDEPACLSAFDARVDAIHNVAREAYSHGRKTVYVLTTADFR